MLRNHRHWLAWRLVVTVSIALGMSAGAFAQPAALPHTVVVSGEHQRESLNGAFSAYEAVRGATGDSALPANPDSVQWRPVGNRAFHAVLSRSRWWLRAELRNLDSTWRDRVVIAPQPTLDDVQFSLRCDDGYEQSSLSGDSRPVSSRMLPDRNPAFMFVMPPRARCTLLVSLATLETVAFPAILADLSTYSALQQRDNMVRGLGLGMQALLVVGGLLLLAVTRTRKATLYVGMSAAQTLLILTMSGLGYQFLWGDIPKLQQYLAPVSIATAWALSAAFCARLLPVEVTQGTTGQLLRGTYLLAFLVTFLHVLMPDPRNIAILIAAIAVGLLLLAAVTAGAVVLGATRAGLAVASIVVLTAAATLECLNFLGMISLGENFLLVLQGGFLLQGGLLGYLLWEPHINRRQDRILDREIDRRVAERTRELASTVAKLTSVNRRLDHLSTTDALTGTYNRRYLDHHLVQVAHNGGRSPLSFILFDIDFFKHVNDRYGHPVGDRCLRIVAESALSQLRDENDILCRYGGEEFAIILPNTDIEGAKAVAEKIRRAVAAVPVHCTPGVELHVTISLGVSSTCEPDHLEQLVGAADHALYEAKRSGRNRWLAEPA